MIEEAEVVVHEADEPDLLVDFSDADVLPGEDAAQVDLAAVEARHELVELALLLQEGTGDTPVTD